MCGFVGFTGNIVNRNEIIRKMADRIIHRGPDMDGYHLSGEGEEPVALGFRRLSIIDLSEAGRQPMYNEDGSVVIVYNGETYNFPELREELIARGHVFKNRSDTEVLVHGYEEYGTALASKLRGMFAFVIWDKKTNTMYGARDYFGIKPFYYTKTADGNLLFGSEIKSLLEHPGFRREINPEALRPYLTFQYSAMEETFFKGTFKLPAAHWFTWKNGEMHIERYWDADFSRKTGLSFEGAAQEIDDRVRESVKAHKISDVPVGSFLSGGVDSSYITACLMPDKTFSVGFDSGDNSHKFNETGEAGELSEKLGIANYRDMLTKERCLEAFADIQYHMDEPQSNPSSVPLYFLAKLAKEHVTVVLSGEGADEIYAGYEWYDTPPALRKYEKLPLPLRRLAGNITHKLPYFKGHDFILKGSGKPELWFIGQALVFPEDEAYGILRPKYRVGPTASQVAEPIYDRVRDLPELEKKQYLDLNLWLPGDILLKADKMSMAHSLELRVPYLDREVMGEAAAYPVDYKIAGDTKAVLRHAANKTLPDEWANRKKKGFPVPLTNWLRDEKFSAIVKDSFTSDAAAEYFDTDKLVSLLADPAHNRRKIWTAYTFLTWHKQFFEGGRF
ncbi:MAG: asparagine synthase (glutamine-hydrolyzing) [Clostridia bacterium]|nr:asparagine synthase (glutamine-hydrolyzing) [Clostridia bacterium]